MPTDMIIGKYKVFIEALEDKQGFVGCMERPTRKTPIIGAWAYTERGVVSKIQTQIRLHNQKVIDKYLN